MFLGLVFKTSPKTAVPNPFGVRLVDPMKNKTTALLKVFPIKFKLKSSKISHLKCWQLVPSQMHS